MKNLIRKFALLSIGAFAAGLMAACQDSPVAPMGPLTRPAPGSSVRDATAGHGAEVIVLHTGKGRSKRFVILEGKVTLENGHAVRPSAEMLASLRKAGHADEINEAIKKQFGGIWK